jgi:acid stress-induced BolA-like protein IbaG/YrbA
VKKEELKQTLEGLGWTEVDEEHGRFTAIVVSPSFEGMDEGERQYLVWKRVLDRLGSPASVAVEFIYTYSPSEKERLDRGEALEELLD